MMPESKKRVRFGGLFSNKHNFNNGFAPPPLGYPPQITDPFMYRNRMYNSSSREQLLRNPEYVPRWMRTPLYNGIGDPFIRHSEDPENVYVRRSNSKRNRRFSNRSIKSQERLLNSISYQERQNLIHNFQRFDSNGDGYITPRELKTHLKNKDGSPFSSATIRLIYRLFNSENNDGYLDLNEFYVLLKNLESWNFQFNSVDAYGYGKIDFTGFLTLLRQFGYKTKPATCSYIYKLFARRSTMGGSAFTSFFGMFGNSRDQYDSSNYYQNLKNNSGYGNQNTSFGKKYLMKFDKFFECFLLLTYFYNQYNIQEVDQSIDLDRYLTDHFYSYYMQHIDRYY